MEEALLCGNWQGLDRATAPHLLDAGKSPDTTDAAYHTDKQGLLGPRGGRKILLSEGYNLLGVIPYSFPWGEGRIIATAAGDLRFTEDSFPSTTTAAQTGWDTLNYGRDSTYHVIQTGAGTANGATLTLSAPVSLSSYGQISVGNGDPGSYGVPCTISKSGGTPEGYVMLQGNIDGVWTDLMRINTDFVTGAVSYVQQRLTAGTGTLTAIRAQVIMSSGTGAIELYLNRLRLHLVRGSEYQEISVS